MKTLINNKIISSATFAFAMLLFPAANATVFVNSAATGTNNGTSWKNAYTSLQSALGYATSHPGSQIWVAAGVYKPSAFDPTDPNVLNGLNAINGSTDPVPSGDPANPFPSSPQRFSFVVPNQTTIIGGFAGTESSASQRKFTTLSGANDVNDDSSLEGGELLKNVTVLSGDLNGDDVIDRTNPNYYNLRNDNAYHVLTILNATVTLDGLDVKGGYASGVYYRQARGAGIYINSGNVTLANMKVEDNDTMATDYQGAGGIGGGLMTTHAGGVAPTVLNVSNSIFANNYVDYQGAAISSISALVTMSGSTIRNNQAGACGDFHIQDGSLLLKNSIVKNTYSYYSCAGIRLLYVGNDPAYPSSVVGNIFRNNSGSDCGTIRAENSVGAPAPLLSITGNVFNNNQSRTFDPNSAGPACGVICLFSWDASVTGNTFTGNSGISSGVICVNMEIFGFYGDYFATANITGNVFTNNSVTSNDDRGAGAIKVELGQIANITGNTFIGNRTPGNGGAIGVYGTLPAWFTPDFEQSPESAYVARATIKGNTFVSDVAGGLGNNIYGQGANLTVTGNSPNTYVNQ